MLRGYSRVSSFLLALSCVWLFAGSAGATPLVNGLIDDFTPVGPADLLLDRVIFNDGLLNEGTGILVFGAGGTQLTLTYDGGLTSNFVIHGSIIEIPVIGYSGGAVDLKVTVMDGTATTDDVAVVINSLGVVQVPFSSFSGIAFNDVESITFDFTALGDDASFTLDEIRVVPEPATAMMLGVGLMGLTFVGRRQVA
jgi:hypothetical protein